MREDGYYWVKISDKNEWKPMFWDDEFKNFEENNEYYWKEKDLFKINETRIKTPDEK